MTLMMLMMTTNVLMNILKYYLVVTMGCLLSCCFNRWPIPTVSIAMVSDLSVLLDVVFVHSDILD